MKFLAFSFKKEAMWTMIFAFAPIAIALFIFLVVYLLRSWIW
jgi:hypothetical protein